MTRGARREAASRSVFRIGLVSATLWACDPLASPEYLGEPLASIKGSVASWSTPPQGPADLVVLYIDYGPIQSTGLGERVPVTESFPVGFSIPLMAPPATDALNDIPGEGEPRIGIAWFVVLRSGAAKPGPFLTHEDFKGLENGDVLGWAEDSILTYVDGEAAEGSTASEILGGPKATGFHLMAVQGKLAEDASCSLVCDTSTMREVDMASTTVMVSLSADPSTLRIPTFRLPDRVEDAFGITTR
ncbi:MAG: hypothetical protein HYV07_02385 [Deltaproteobacteria bacterium]|nr:hypothetical protein [Deltaproteobacteria bacterium]